MESQTQIVLITGAAGMVGFNIQTVLAKLRASDSKLTRENALEQMNKLGNRKSVSDFLQSEVAEKQFKFITRQDADLTDFQSTKSLFEKVKPHVVLHLAAKVGGLFANMNSQVEFFEQNLAINHNVIKCSHLFNVSRLVCCLSTCIFPDKPVLEGENYTPIKEFDLQTGPPHSSNEGYAYAKRMCEVQCRLYNEQYGTDFVCIVPTNLYGPNDCYDQDKSHVVASLVRRAYEVKERGGDSLLIWGSGKPLRQFCFAEDLALLSLWVLLKPESKQKLISLVPQQEYSINELAMCVAKAVGLNSLENDYMKQDGQYRKTMSSELLFKELPNFEFTPLSEGVRLTVEDFKLNY